MRALTILLTYRPITMGRFIGEDFLGDFLISSGAHIPIMDSMIIIMDIMAGIMVATPFITDRDMAHQ
jgi:hydrogenase/urease accessory protein HupE